MGVKVRGEPYQTLDSGPNGRVGLRSYYFLLGTRLPGPGAPAPLRDHSPDPGGGAWKHRLSRFAGAHWQCGTPSAAQSTAERRGNCWSIILYPNLHKTPRILR